MNRFGRLGDLVGSRVTGFGCIIGRIGNVGPVHIFYFP